MPEPHETILVRVADNGYGEDEFQFSGSFNDGFESSPTLTLYWLNDCSGDTAGTVYKFDQSDSTNNGYRLAFSATDNAHCNAGVALGEPSGVFYYGTPGQAGASTKVHLGIMFSGQATGAASAFNNIHPYAPSADCAYDFGQGSFAVADASGEECASGNYDGPATSSSATSSSATSSSATSSSTGPTSSSATSSSTGPTSSSATSSSTGPTSSSATSSSSSSCVQSVEFTGQLNTLITTTNSTQSGKYGSFTTQSYSIATGVETGQFTLGIIVATGASLSDALTDLTPLISHFNASGVLIDELTDSTSTTNINNNSTSYSSVFSGQSSSTYYQGVTGYVNNRYYVGYNPQISGNYSGANVVSTCPDTSIQVNFNRNRLIYDTTGTLAQPENTITQFVASLDSRCTGFDTTLQVACSKFANGERKYGNITFSENILDAWSGSLEEGSYILRHESGSFTTALGKHTLGSGTVNVDRYV